VDIVSQMRKAASKDYRNRSDHLATIHIHDDRWN